MIVVQILVKNLELSLVEIGQVLPQPRYREYLFEIVHDLDNIFKVSKSSKSRQFQFTKSKLAYALLNTLYVCNGSANMSPILITDYWVHQRGFAVVAQPMPCPVAIGFQSCHQVTPQQINGVIDCLMVSCSLTHSFIGLLWSQVWSPLSFDQVV